MSTAPTCKFWRRGACKRGAYCQFRHGLGAAKPDKAMLADAGQLLETVDGESLASLGGGDGDEPVSLTDYEFLSSYNWVDDDTAPVIYVPGGPPVWRDSNLPLTVAKDQGSYFVDQNAARCAAYPAEALFRSLAVQQKELSMLDFDLVTDRNCLRKLLGFVSKQDLDKSFRIDIQLQGDVMFLGRWEVDQRRVILGHQNYGFGHGFEKATTTFDHDLRDSSGHHRVVRYNLGGVRCLVRYEADGCLEQEVGEAKAVADVVKVDDEADLLDALQSMSISAKDSPGSVRVLHKGRVVPSTDIVEIKTRVGHRRLQDRDLDEVVIPQLWFAQTRNLFVGYHVSGTFGEVHTIKPDLEEWEKRHQPDLKKLVTLLQKLHERALTTQHRRCVVVCGHEGHQSSSARLKVYESEKEAAVLPADILEQYEWTAGKEIGETDEDKDKAEVAAAEEGAEEAENPEDSKDDGDGDDHDHDHDHDHSDGHDDESNHEIPLEEA